MISHFAKWVNKYYSFNSANKNISKNDTNNLVEFTFENKQDKEILIWTEPAAYEIVIPPKFEYKLVTDDKKFTIEFNNDNMTFWLVKRFGYKLLKRKLSTNPNEKWEIDIDTFNIQFEKQQIK